MSTLLVVDDEFDIAEALKAILEFEGHEVVTALDGKAGLEALRKLRPPLVLLDLMMPQLDGSEVLARARKEGLLEGTKVILMSAVKPPGTADELGYCAFLSKPFELKKLLKIVQQCLEPTEEKKQTAS